MQQGQVELQGNVRRLELLHKEVSEKIDQIIESVSPEMVKNNEQDARLDDHDQKLLAQSGRLNILEAA